MTSFNRDGGACPLGPLDPQLPTALIRTWNHMSVVCLSLPLRVPVLELQAQNTKSLRSRTQSVSLWTLVTVVMTCFSRPQQKTTK